ncbi:polyprenyl synthetase family protein [Candidatus Anaplasma sp. TIGMIC]|uniref:polyprenyl synthetase family protein n=1 Tax=Candidatus Anaplasma sp. TIGMIC TaxID=3020713 RepID=UPI00232B342E|nr:polyprenyl synthetase family protein [Candidatus Anaplasma sp. TIGMIC]MDB1135217.1 polyprenyl synthetase family protein [Candidatus Anaplasma sp. TIGMIC]
MRYRLPELMKSFSVAMGAELAGIVAQRSGSSPQLAGALRYCVSTPGKCLRAFLAGTIAKIFGVAEARFFPMCAAIEAIHTYSLVHDDMPCMDDAATRRGKASCHCEYGEAMALLVGDSLLTLAFELLSAMEEDCTVKCEIIKVISRACGCSGMAAGQALDMEGKADSQLEAVKRIHELKTACLFAAACESGAILAGASDDTRETLAAYGKALGCAFQAQDDLNDVGEDVRRPNIVNVLGADGTAKYVDSLLHQCEAHLESLNADTVVLKELVMFVRNLSL